MNAPPRRLPGSFTSSVSALCLAAVVASVGGCHGSSSSTSSTTTTTNYTLGGTITGLTTSSVVLANGSATVTVSAGASTWAFSSTFTAGSSYAVTVQTQPTGETCEVASGGSGTNTGSVGNITVICGYGQWAWKAGASTVDAAGVYGTEGTAVASNIPGARYAASTWTDAAGNFWLFGGVGEDSTGTAGYLNDLWKYSPSTHEWTWVGGGNVANAAGLYGTQGSAAAGNGPGGRQGGSAWIDASGNLWLFGGSGKDSAGVTGKLNDLWEYDPHTGLWTWVGGASTANTNGTYGTSGIAAAGNLPGARQSASTWTDASGNFWLFGGAGLDGTGHSGNLSDLWKYAPSSGQWTWEGGTSTVNSTGVYGTEGTAAAGNLPGARYSASAWTDASGNFWLFGGYGYDSTGTAGKLGDLWEYVPASKQWTWVSGQDVAGAPGYYGTLGTASTSSAPGARQSSKSWIDSSGNLWLFGGIGYDTNGAVGNLNDLWEYSTTNKEWTWISGSNTADAAGSYGSLGTGSVGAAPGGRDESAGWIDSSGNLWLFGGYGHDSGGTLEYLNDLWEYTPQSG